MYLKKVEGPRSVTLPGGDVMTRADLPDPSTTRWVASRKAAVVRGVLYQLLTREQAIDTYGLSEEELDEWVRGAALLGADGLKATRTADVRERALSQDLDKKKAT